MREEINILSQLLKASGKSKRDLADCWGRKPSAASAFFNGKRELALGDLDKTAELLNMTTADLVAKLRGQEESESSNDSLFELALKRGREAVDRRNAKLDRMEFVHYVYELYKHALAEKRMEGKAFLSAATADIFLKAMLEVKMPH